MTMAKIYDFPSSGGIDGLLDAIAQHLRSESHPVECVEFVTHMMREVLLSIGAPFVTTVPMEAAAAVKPLIEVNNALTAELVFAVTRIWYLEFKGGAQ